MPGPLNEPARDAVAMEVGVGPARAHGHEDRVVDEVGDLVQRRRHVGAVDHIRRPVSDAQLPESLRKLSHVLRRPRLGVIVRSLAGVGDTWVIAGGPPSNVRTHEAMTGAAASMSSTPECTRSASDGVPCRSRPRADK